MDNKFIVAEVTKNWEQGTFGQGGKEIELLSQMFELVINTNFERGYKLIDWKISSVVCNSDKDSPAVLTETIIAIFEKIETEKFVDNQEHG